MTVALIIIIIALMLFVVATTVLFAVRANRGNKRKIDIHMSGGADIMHGFVTFDNNYFKGLSGELEKTDVLQNRQKDDRFSKISIRLFDASASVYYDLTLNPEIVIGRQEGAGIFTVSGDGSVSKRHCRLLAYQNAVFVEDLKSSNHTFINGRQIDSPYMLSSGDEIKIGNTVFNVYFKTA